MSDTINTLASLEIVPTGAPLGAEIRGIDLSKPMNDDVRSRLKQAWYDHLVLLFRDQSLDEDAIAGVGDLFGGAQITGHHLRLMREGVDIPSHLTTRRPEVSVISNLDESGNPVADNDALGSLEVVWHSDNSFVEVPPAGTFLYCLEAPEDGGDTSFNNQYLAWSDLPDDLKDAIWRRYQKQDSSRNSAGKLRKGVQMPTTTDEVEGPVHPMVRRHPYTGRNALYLGRRRSWPSNFIVGMPNDESEALLDRLWEHACRDDLKWTQVWRPGDAVLWDNRCVMHYRTPINPNQRRVMWRTLVKGEPIVPAWDDAAERAANG